MSVTTQPPESLPMGERSPGWLATARQAITEGQARQSDGELAALLALADSVDAESVLEIGTGEGGTAWAFAQVPSVRRIVTVDAALSDAADKRLTGLRPSIKQITGAIGSPDIRQSIGVWLGRHPADLVFVDGPVAYQDARAAVEWAAGLAQPGGLLALAGTRGNGRNSHTGIPQLWSELAGRYAGTELVDKLYGPGGIGVIWL